MTFAPLRVQEMRCNQYGGHSRAVEVFMQLVGSIPVEAMQAINRACTEGKTLEFALVDNTSLRPRIIPGTVFEFAPRLRQMDDSPEPIFSCGAVVDFSSNKTTVFR